MSDIVERLREAHPNSAQRFAGSTILLDAADEIERLEKARDYAIRWANKAVEDVKASYEAELANARNAAMEEAAALIDRTPICELQRTNEDRPDRIFEIAAGTQSIHDARLVRSLKAEGESR